MGTLLGSPTPTCAHRQPHQCLEVGRLGLNTLEAGEGVVGPWSGSPPPTPARRQPHQCLEVGCLGLNALEASEGVVGQVELREQGAAIRQGVEGGQAVGRDIQDLNAGAGVRWSAPHRSGMQLWLCGEVAADRDKEAWQRGLVGAKLPILKHCRTCLQYVTHDVAASKCTIALALGGGHSLLISVCTWTCCLDPHRNSHRASRLPS